MLTAAGGVGLLVAREAFRGETNVSVAFAANLVPGSDTAPATAPSVASALGVDLVRLANGTHAPITVPGEPMVVMLSSTTCGWCKQALSDFGTFARGRPVPRLTLLTLEGAGEGAPMLGRERLSGARLVGPSSSNDQVHLTFRYVGTPTFIAVDRNGRVLRTMPGYPTRAELERWFAVMVGETTVP